MRSAIVPCVVKHVNILSLATIALAATSAIGFSQSAGANHEIWIAYKVVSQSLGYATIKGTWRLRDGGDAHPIQTTTVECDKREGFCTEATVIIADNKFIMPIQLRRLVIESWSNRRLRVRGDHDDCTDYVYVFDFIDETGAGQKTAKVAASANCDATFDPRPVILTGLRPLLERLADPKK